LVTSKRSFITEDNDILDIYDGNDDGVQLGKFYGYYPVENLAPVVSYSGKMRLVFTSDATMQRQGFRVQYESSTVICIQICTNFKTKLLVRIHVQDMEYATLEVAFVI
jgi:hypothetical protein